MDFYQRKKRKKKESQKKKNNGGMTFIGCRLPEGSDMSEVYLMGHIRWRLPTYYAAERLGSGAAVSQEQAPESRI
jgi:hypothetical protein